MTHSKTNSTLIFEKIRQACQRRHDDQSYVHSTLIADDVHALLMSMQSDTHADTCTDNQPCTAYDEFKRQFGSGWDSSFDMSMVVNDQFGSLTGMDRQVDGQSLDMNMVNAFNDHTGMGRQTDGHTDRQTDGQSLEMNMVNAFNDHTGMGRLSLDMDRQVNGQSLDVNRQTDGQSLDMYVMNDQTDSARITGETRVNTAYRMTNKGVDTEEVMKERDKEKDVLGKDEESVKKRRRHVRICIRRTANGVNMTGHNQRNDQTNDQVNDQVSVSKETGKKTNKGIGKGTGKALKRRPVRQAQSSNLSAQPSKALKRRSVRQAQSTNLSIQPSNQSVQASSQSNDQSVEQVRQAQSTNLSIQPSNLSIQASSQSAQTSNQPVTYAQLMHVLRPRTRTFSTLALHGVTKIAEASFSDVYRHAGHVYKVIPITRHYTREEFLKEVHVLQTLRDEPCVVRMRAFFFCTGRYNAQLMDAWDAYARVHSTENDKPDGRRVYGCLVMDDAGTDLERYVFRKERDVVAVMRTIVGCLAVLEEKYRFEHRDMHWGNILISDSARVSIIDFGLSRLVTGHGLVYKDMSAEQDIFNGKGDEQYDVYRAMRACNGNEWSTFNAYTNVLWCKYLLNKMREKGLSTGMYGRMKSVMDRCGSAREISMLMCD